MYIDEDRAGGLYAAAMAKVNFSETLYNDTDKKDDAQTDIAIAYGVELFYKTVIDYLKDDENK